MNVDDKLIIIEKARVDYGSGDSYKEISLKYNIPINTLKSWKRRYGWARNSAPEEGCKSKKLHQLENDLYQEIKEDLLLQLSLNETEEKRYIDMVDDYMSFWDIKNRLIEDIRIRGVSVEWNNGKQVGRKKNDSVSELVKVNAQMLKILNELNLKPVAKAEDEYDI